MRRTESSSAGEALARLELGRDTAVYSTISSWIADILNLRKARCLRKIFKSLDTVQTSAKACDMSRELPCDHIAW